MAGMVVHFLYVDEAGCTGTLPNTTSQIQPVFVISGIILQQQLIRRFNLDFIQLKKRFFPGRLPRSAHFLDHIRGEIKGAELRAAIREKQRPLARASIGFLDRTVELLDRNSARLLGRVWVKGLANPMNGTAVYTFSIQDICRSFQRFLESVDDVGMVVVDPRLKSLNSSVSHSIFTVKHSAAGDPLDRILEMPVFGHAENHAAMQIADLTCSALLFPMATHAYCLGTLTSVHVSAEFAVLRSRYGDGLRQLQYRYLDGTKWRGGVVLSDQLGQRHGGHLFAPPIP